MKNCVGDKIIYPRLCQSDF